MPSHQERVRTSETFEPPDTPVSTRMIVWFEKDVRTLLDTLEFTCFTPEIQDVIKRVRRAVGYSA